MSTNSLAGKVAIVTGAAGGLGAASARRLSASGARIVAVDVNDRGLHQLVRSLDGPAIGVLADVAEEADVDRYMVRAVEEYGRVDLHHVNAGISGSAAALPDLTAADFDRVIAVNLRGAFLGVRAAFQQYQIQGGAGAIVITASIASLRGSADLLPYQVSKHGVLGLLHGAAMFGGPLGIRVNAVAPGIVPTDLFAGPASGVGTGTDGDADTGANGDGGIRADGGATARADMVRRAATTPLRRAGTPDEIAAVVAFLLSDDASYVCGEVISADGGAAAVSTVRPSGGAGAWDTGPADGYVGADRRAGVQ
jgi:NAD(P)-dependent dehydrogenase (short-subunit alcohol dehydrogenase family)